MTQIIVPIAAASVAALIHLAEQARAEGADAVELRLDTCIHLGAPGIACIEALPNLGLPTLVTCRHVSEHGHWDGPAESRSALYQAALDHGARWLDCELAHWPELVALGWSPQRVHDAGALLLLSYHDFVGVGDDLNGRITRMRAAGAHIAKVAVTARDGADLAIIRDLYAEANGPLVAIAMGEHGAPSRQLAGVWGAVFTFARHEGAVGSAPGQPTVRELIDTYRLHAQKPTTAIYGILGSPVAHSLSPHIHNAAFAHLGIDAVYARFRADDAVAFWKACGSWITGLSVTLPHKQALLPLMNGREQLVEDIGAMNTVFRDGQEAIAANTDATAIVQCLEEGVGSLPGRKVLVLGAGGVARALAFAVRARGAEVAITNRTHARAAELAHACGGIALDEAAARAYPYDILANGTAVGMNAPDDTPWPSDAHRPGSVVFDTVYTPMETRLLRDAAASGATTICGVEMFIDQAVGQCERWTGKAAPEHLMRRVVLAQLKR